jgi:hypothetical protein
MRGSRRDTLLTEVLEDDRENSRMPGDHSVRLSQSALRRFDRLRARIDGLMLNAIQGHLEDIKAIGGTVSSLASNARILPPHD